LYALNIALVYNLLTQLHYIQCIFACTVHLYCQLYACHSPRGRDWYYTGNTQRSYCNCLLTTCHVL